MDSIMANVEKVDMSPAVKLFNNKVVEEQIKRPEGQVDMLIGLHAAALFPTMENSEQDVAGNLRLLSTKFETGWLADGQHPEVVPTWMRTTSQALHSKIDAVEKARCKISKITNHVTNTEDEEIGEQQPRRCSAGTGGKICADGAVTGKKEGRLGTSVDR